MKQEVIDGIPLTDELVEWLVRSTDNKSRISEKEGRKMFQVNNNLRSYLEARPPTKNNPMYYQRSILLSMAIEEYLKQNPNSKLFENSNPNTMEKLKQYLISDGYSLEEEIHNMVLKKANRTITIQLKDE